MGSDVDADVVQTTRAAEATLAPSFASLQLKKFELEFAVDPLFKKASADFDEGGAKGLLLNHLAIDGEGRIVFDSSDDAVESEEQESRRKSGATDAEGEEEAEEDNTPATPNPEVSESMQEDGEIDIAGLASKFFPDLDILDEQDICPSLKTFDLGNPAGSLDIPFLKAPDDWRDKPQAETDSGPSIADRSGIMLDDDNAAGFDDDDGLFGGFDVAADAGFGEGGEAWAKEAALEPMLKVHCTDMGEEQGMNDENGDGVAVGDFNPASNNPYAVSLNHKAGDEHENILSYFDNALKKNWAGPEHWRIRRIKESTTTTVQPRQRKEKEPFEIEFAAPLSQAMADMIYTPATSNSTISLPKSQWRSKTRNLLPDDKHFSSRDLLRLFLKPKARFGSRKLAPGMPPRTQQSSDSAEPLGEEYWAAHKPNDAQPEAGPSGDYDADFFNDDDGLAFPGGVPDMDDDDENFADARETFSPPVEGERATQSIDAIAGGEDKTGIVAGGFGAQLVTQGGRRLRPEYVNYARVAKKVDVRRLKENLWKSIEPTFNLSPVIPLTLSQQPEEVEKDPDAMDIDDPEPPPPMTMVDSTDGNKAQDLKFTTLMNSLQQVYPESAMKDISTSYCFICLLHLANERGLVLEGESGLREISVRRDGEVGGDYVGE
jgi:condensin complex subunit 2